MEAIIDMISNIRGIVAVQVVEVEQTALQGILASKAPAAVFQYPALKTGFVLSESINRVYNASKRKI